MKPEATFRGISTFFKYPSFNYALPSVATIGICGVPFDGGSSYRSGSRFSPAEIRRLSVLPRIEQNPIGISLDNSYPIYDIGDIDIVTNNVEKTLYAIENFVAEFPKTMKLVFVGGDNTISLGALRGIIKKYGQVALVQLDAHADLDNGLWGEDYFHGSWARHAADEKLIDVNRWIRIGARSKFGREQSEGYPTDIFDISDIRYSQHKYREAISALGATPTYISIDLDVLDCGIAPAVGVPVPGGLSSSELFNILYELSKLNIVGCDIVEYVPPYDRSEQTGVLAAYILQALLACITNPPNDQERSI